MTPKISHPQSARADILSRQVIGAAIDIHRSVGPGLLESAYDACLCRELELRDIPLKRQVPVELMYKEVRLGCVYRVDIVVDDVLVIEIKAIQAINEIHVAQALTYLRLLHLPVGLIINFNAPTLVKGIKRVVNNH